MRKYIKQISVLLLGLSLTACGGKVLVEKPKLDLDPKPIAVDTSKGDDKRAPDQWSLDQLNMTQVWQKYAGSRAVKVMLIGTGVDYNHEDLRPNVPVEKVGEKYRVGRDFVDDDHLAFDTFGHDTYLAGVIGAAHDNGKGIKGVLPAVSLYPVRYIDRNGVSTLPQLIKALEHIKEVRPHVVLLNLISVPLSEFEKNREVELAGLREALKSVKAAKIPVIMGAGNSSKALGVNDPLRSVFFEFDNVFVVTSVDQSKNKPWVANFSAQYVHTTAPGVEVMTTALGNKYKAVSSANVAAAHVAAAIGYAEALHSGQKTYEDYFSALMSTAGSESVPALRSQVLGGNTLNVLKFLNTL